MEGLPKLLICFIENFLRCFLDHKLLKGFHNRRMVHIFQHGHVEIPLPAWRDKGQDLKIQRMKDGDIRGNADAEIIGNKSCGNLVLIDFKSHIRVLADTLKQLVNDLAETTSSS